MGENIVSFLGKIYENIVSFLIKMEEIIVSFLGKMGKNIVFCRAKMGENIVSFRGRMGENIVTFLAKIYDNIFSFLGKFKLLLQFTFKSFYNLHSFPNTNYYFWAKLFPFCIIFIYPVGYSTIHGYQKIKEMH